MQVFFRVLALGALVTVAGAASAQADDEGRSDSPPHEEQGGAERELNNHRFVIPAEIDNAFMVSSLAFDQGFGVATLQSAEVDAKLFLLRERFRVQVGIANVVALEASADASAGVAGNFETLLNQAAAANLEFATGPKVRLFTLKEAGVQVSTGLYYRTTLDYTVSPSAALASGSTSQLLTKNRSAYIDPALMVAWGGGALGLQLEVRPSITTNRLNAPSELQAGAAIGLDLNRPTKGVVPFALTVEYNLQKTLDGADPEHYLTSGVFYSAKRDLQLGLRYSKVVGMPGEKLQFGTLNLGYFF